MGVAVSKKASRDSGGGDDAAMASVGRWLEWALYKILLLSLLVGVANSNEALRKMLDAIK
jgi:hypothetical protein